MRRLLVLVPLTAAVAVLAAPSARPDTPPALRSRAQTVLAQVNALDQRVEQVVEAYNAAGVELARTQRSLRLNARALVAGRKNLRRAQAALARRLVARSEPGGRDSRLDSLVGATSLSDVIARADAAERVSELDAQVVDQVRRLETRLQVERQKLRRELVARQRLRASLAQRRQWIENRLAARRSLLASIQGEVAQLQAQERARQAQLRQAVETRLTQPPPPPVPPVANSAGPGHPEVVPIAMRYLGVPYKWGGASPSTGFDCSGLVLYVYAQIGISLPHYAAAQYGYGAPVARSALLPGDIVFFNDLGHDGIYIGGGQFIDAPKTGDVVKIENLNDPWWSDGYVGARRLP